jgi:TPR repeat protein
MRNSTAILISIIILFFTSNSAFAAVSTKSPENKIALVIGNSAYQNSAALKNTINDAKAISNALSDLDFRVIISIDDSTIDLNKKIDDFVSESANFDVVFFYYAGHGAQKNGKNYLLPIDFGDSDSSPLDFSSIANRIQLSSPQSAKIFVVDACRNLPDGLAERFGPSNQRGLARVTLPTVDESDKGAQGYFNIIAFSTAAGTTASDGAGQNSPYTGSLVKYLPQAGIEVADLFRQVAADVLISTKGVQRPEFLVQTSRVLYFKDGIVTDCDRAAVEQENYLGLVGIPFEDVNPAVAVPVCEEAVRKDPTSSRLMNNLGRAYERAGRLEDALTWYARGHQAGNIQATNALGVAYIAGCGMPEPEIEKGVELLIEAKARGSRDARASLTAHDLTDYVSADIRRRAAKFLKNGDRWDEAARTKLREYQKAHGLAQNGLTIETLYAMNLHSGLPKGFKCH